MTLGQTKGSLMLQGNRGRSVSRKAKMCRLGIRKTRVAVLIQSQVRAHLPMFVLFRHKLEIPARVTQVAQFSKTPLIPPVASITGSVTAFDDKQLFCVCDVYILILKEKIHSNSLFILEAIINSNLMSFYLNHRLSSIKTIFPKIPIQFLKSLPIKNDYNDFNLDGLIDQLHKLPWDSEDFNHHERKLLSEINRMIFSMYRLSENEIRMIEGG